ncbi:hypothetical protein AAEX28_02545 [Lentisphaerota bacterium WC36G]|nr:hypothetical protein LJT99_05430 [Lentisphaerae bacterium WC36]
MNIAKGEKWQLNINNFGEIQQLLYSESYHDKDAVEQVNSVPFHCDDSSVSEFCGPALYVDNQRVILNLKEDADELHFVGVNDDVSYRIKVEEINGRLKIFVHIGNFQNIPLQPESIKLRLGIDCYMDKFPEWNHKFFPTFLRCEKSHFNGYFMTPSGKVLTISSPNELAAWELCYNKSGTDNDGNQFNGHRIYTVDLVLLANNVILPERHAQNLKQIKANSFRNWEFIFEPTDCIDDSLVDIFATNCDAPIFNIERPTILNTDNNFNFSITSLNNLAAVTVLCNEQKELLEPIEVVNSCYNYQFSSFAGVGEYIVIATDKNGKKSEARFYKLQDFAWYLEYAAKNAVRASQRATSHCEAYYGLFSLINSVKNFDKRNKGKAFANYTQRRINEILNEVFDFEKMKPKFGEERIQNISTLISILVAAYKAFEDPKFFEQATSLVKFFIENYFKEDGGFYSPNGIDYSCVIYPAKSLMEYLEAFSLPCFLDNCAFNHEELRHKLNSVITKNINHIANKSGDLQTEGETTFNDGTVSCAALQIAMYALLTRNGNESLIDYVVSAKQLLKSHDALTQKFVPDARMRSCTLRFWDAQYDVLINHNMISSPHGWSAWRSYGTYYLYLLTGRREYLIETLNSLGAMCQLIDQYGVLNWAFVVDPNIYTEQICKDIFVAYKCNQKKSGHYHTHKYPKAIKKYHISEEYLPMVGTWFEGNSNDNNVHEVFKAMDEIILSNAFVIVNSDNITEVFNCNNISINGLNKISFSSKLIKKVHFNLAINSSFIIDFEDGEAEIHLAAGRHWMPIPR